MIERIMRYSTFYGDLISKANRLSKDGESYVAFLTLFNALELICKSLRETDNGNLSQDIAWLAENGFFSDEEKELLSGENGLRRIRNTMMHRNPYAHFFEANGVLYSFAEKETWDYAYQQLAPNVIKAIVNAIEHSYK